jgi:very-short-patch-repair endonuclease
MRTPDTSVERKLARIAAEQRGLATRAQLLAAGLSRSAIRRRLAKGSLLPEHRGVYWVGHRDSSWEAGYLAAYLFRLVKGEPPPPEVFTRGKRRIRGIRTSRRQVDARDAAVFDGFPVTTVPRTLVDLAAVFGEEALARACHEAGVRYRTPPRQVEAVLQRWPNAPGATKLRRILRGETRVTLSKLEKRFLELLREASLPLPQTNRVAGEHRVDCRWPERRLTIELDSYRFHNSRYSWELDRRRERAARARGDQFGRFTWGDVFEAPGAMLRELGVLLQAASDNAGSP